jgi:hypothetical protein
MLKMGTIVRAASVFATVGATAKMECTDTIVSGLKLA